MNNTLTYSAPSVWLVYGMVFLPIIVAAALVMIVRAASRKASNRFAIGLGALMVIQFTLAVKGVLRHWEWSVPPILPLLAITFAFTVWFAFSPTGERLVATLPGAWFIGFQLFRLPLELLMNQASLEQVMPPQMTYTGLNFDIITGLTAIPMFWLASRGMMPRWLLFAWNLLGCALLANIVGIAILSTPAIAAFGPNRLNIWIADAPFIWLPGVLVQAALFCHIITMQKLIHGSPITVKFRYRATA